jgi:hypothetical protein
MLDTVRFMSREPSSSIRSIDWDKKAHTEYEDAVEASEFDRLLPSSSTALASYVYIIRRRSWMLKYVVDIFACVPPAIQSAIPKSFAQASSRGFS